MKTYKVTIRAIIFKTYTVEAEDENIAGTLANERFSVNSDEIEEDYDQDVTNVEEVEHGTFSIVPH